MAQSSTSNSMRPLSIPPFYRCFIFSCQSVLFLGTAVRVVYASDLEHANRYMNEWLQEQGIDYKFRYICEVSREDIHVVASDYDVVSLRLF